MSAHCSWGVDIKTVEINKENISFSSVGVPYPETVDIKACLQLVNILEKW